MKPNPTIFDLGIERNDEQNKAHGYAWLTWGGFFVFVFICWYFGSIINDQKGAVIGLTLSFMSVLFLWIVARCFYEASITPTQEQLNEFNKRRGIVAQGLFCESDEE